MNLLKTLLVSVPLCLLYANCALTIGPENRGNALSSDSVPRSIARIVSFEVPPFPVQRQPDKSASEQDVIEFAHHNADLLRGRRIMYWTDRYYKSLGAALYDKVFPDYLDQYLLSAIIAGRFSAETVEKAYLPLLVDADDEVRYLGAHTLILAYNKRNAVDKQKLLELAEFCLQDESALIRGLADENHFIYHYYR